jgi:hypothetical protein
MRAGWSSSGSHLGKAKSAELDPPAVKKVSNIIEAISSDLKARPKGK